MLPNLSCSLIDKPLSLGIKSLAEIRWEKNAERGHIEEEEEEEEGMDEDEEEPRLFPSLTRRIIAVSSNGK